MVNMRHHALVRPPVAAARAPARHQRCAQVIGVQIYFAGGKVYHAIFAHRHALAQGVILGCTEIPSLVSEADVGLALFDTTLLHAEAALNCAVSKA